MADPQLPLRLRLRELADQNLFQKDVAALLGIDTTTVTNWEKGRCKPTLRMIPKVIKFLGYNPLSQSSHDMTLGSRIKLQRMMHKGSQ